LTPDWIEVAGFLTGAVNVWLLARQNIWNWPVALINNAIYLTVFLRAGLYGDAGLQVLYALFGIYGWWNWLHASAATQPLHVQRLTEKQWRWLGAATIAGAGTLALFLARATDSTVPAGDGVTTALALAATWCQSRKYLECWWLWIAADIIYIPLYGYKHLWLTAALYGIFMALCVVGLRSWKRELAQ